MTELIWVAAITTLGTLLGAAVGSLASVFGPAWHERRAREAADRATRDDVRFQRAQMMLEAFGILPTASTYSDFAKIETVRVGFVASLRPGEGQADQFTRDLQAAARADSRNAIDISAKGSTVLFAWLRGDAPITSLTLDTAGIAAAPRK